ncbi:hypothetical protein QBC38DRAFT_522917 [Podospora fimiseda]|uniref:Protein kinase domain-containing protein n=1 Tax=Podospora fimiseda TaxID=252190 RepID=A0AAN7BD07_9PEZI|nr:hypothetical protein QBC38DRAFT_522917 [Podospora fimiseda]
MEDCKVTESFNIWSFGCVLLEFITWQLGGWELVQEFSRAGETFNILLFGWKTDRFYEIFRQVSEGSLSLESNSALVRVKKEIHQFVNKLHAHKKCSETFHDLLYFIMEKMLVIESVNLGRRASCNEVHQKLKEHYNRLIDPDYVIRPVP